MPPNNDSFLVGLIVGLIVPAAGYYLITLANPWVTDLINRPFAFQDRTVAIMAICCNMLPMGFFRRGAWHESVRGLLTVTMGLAVVWFLIYGRAILG